MKRRLWAIADTHLSFSTDKPMDVFGTHWENHAAKIAENWQAQVAPEDIVLLPGDISWGMNFAEAAADLRFLHVLPGKKILGKGNHDYWWQTQSKNEAFVRNEGMDSLYFLFNNAHRVDLDAQETVVVSGTRAWLHPVDWGGEQDRKIYQRELGRFELSLEAARKAEAGAVAEGRRVHRIAMLHYPPRLNHPAAATELDALMHRNGISICLYGHLHGTQAHKRGVRGTVDGIEYINVACDALDFSPRQIHI